MHLSAGYHSLRDNAMNSMPPFETALRKTVQFRILIDFRATLEEHHEREEGEKKNSAFRKRSFRLLKSGSRKPNPIRSANERKGKEKKRLPSLRPFCRVMYISNELISSADRETTGLSQQMRLARDVIVLG